MKTAAPVLFLVVVTAAVVLVHRQLTRHPAAHTALAAAVTPAHRHKARHHASPRVVRVGVGDTLGAIAIRAHTTVSRLEALNPGLDPTALRVGQTITVK